MPDQQPDRFDPWHTKGRANGDRSGDASLVQFAADCHPQPDCGETIGLKATSFLGGHLWLLRWRGRRRLVGRQAHVSMVVTAMAGIIPTWLRWPFTV
jgi:hypothetical protein